MKVLRRLIISVLLAALALTPPALAQEQEVVLKKLAVFPFAVASREPLEGLGDKVQQEILDRLKTDGFSTVPQEDMTRALAAVKWPLNDALVQEIGRKLGADMVI